MTASEFAGHVRTCVTRISSSTQSWWIPFEIFEMREEKILATFEIEDYEK